MASSVSSWVKRPVGAHTTEEIDKRFGRWWFEHVDKRRPIRYTDIGELCRRPGTHLSLLYCWQRHTRNWLKYTRSQHRKRWPAHHLLNIEFFSEFCAHRPWTQKNLFETCSTLPGFGVGYKFWKPRISKGHRAGEFYFVLNEIDYDIRPWKGRMVGTTYLNGRPLLRNMAPTGKSQGGWAFQRPADTSDVYLYRPKFPELGKASESQTAASNSEAVKNLDVLNTVDWSVSDIDICDRDRESVLGNKNEESVENDVTTEPNSEGDSDSNPDKSESNKKTKDDIESKIDD